MHDRRGRFLSSALGGQAGKTTVSWGTSLRLCLLAPSLPPSRNDPPALNQHLLVLNLLMASSLQQQANTKSHPPPPRPTLHPPTPSCQPLLPTHTDNGVSEHLYICVSVYVCSSPSSGSGSAQSCKMSGLCTARCQQILHKLHRPPGVLDHVVFFRWEVFFPSHPRRRSGREIERRQNCNDNDNDTLRKVQPTSVSGLALQA